MNSKSGRCCLLIADDLTGACDSGVQFTLQGISSTTLLDPSVAALPTAEVLCVNTDSRCDAKITARHKVLQTALKLRPCRQKGTLLFKKIDSCLRGNVVSEIEAMMQVFGCKMALISPAFPAMRRIVRNGILYPGENFSASISVSEIFHRESRRSLSEIHNIPLYGGADRLKEALEQARKDRISFLIADSESEQDLYELALAAKDFQQDLLWVGSAGLAQAAAKVLYQPSGKRHLPDTAFQAPIIFLIGSNHPATEAQVEHLMNHLEVELVSFESLEFPGIRRNARAALESGYPLLLRIDRDHTSDTAIRTLWKMLGSERIGGLFLCGGDTGMTVCRALGSNIISLRGEISTGIPWGILSNGLADGIPVITKSGGFGGPSCLSDIVTQFSKPRRAAYGN